MCLYSKLLCTKEGRSVHFLGVLLGPNSIALLVEVGQEVSVEHDRRGNEARVEHGGEPTKQDVLT